MLINLKLTGESLLWCSLRCSKGRCGCGRPEHSACRLGLGPKQRGVLLLRGPKSGCCCGPSKRAAKGTGLLLLLLVVEAQGSWRGHPKRGLGTAKHFALRKQF